MKQKLPFIILAVFVLWVGASMRPPGKVGGYDIKAFGSLPVLLNGRIQPFQSVARNALLAIRGKTTVKIEEEDMTEEDKALGRKRLSASEWILETMLEPEQADQRKLFLIHHPEVQGEMGLPVGQEKYFSFEDLTTRTNETGQVANMVILEDERKRIQSKEEQLRTPFEKQIVALHRSVGIYVRLRTTLRPPDTDRMFGGFEDELKMYEQVIPVGLAMAHQGLNPETDEQRRALQLLSLFFNRYEGLERNVYPLVVPPLAHQEGDRNDWESLGKGLRESMRRGEVHPVVKMFAKMSKGYRNGEPNVFNAAVGEYRHWLLGHNLVKEEAKGRAEFFFNHLEPFYKSMVIYVAALLLAFGYWLNFTPWTRKTGFHLACFAFVIHTLGIIFRMYLEGRPPVTNLYSSAVFVGWGSVGLGMILERIFRGGIGLAVSSVVGFTTLIIAHHLSFNGDTMEMLQAVLDTNFWLATHVVVITLGYASMFVAGFLAILYILRGLLTPTLTPDTARTLTRMTYGIICFSTLFSFVGTILGGIWADQSWGRFWGWDPKENGALMIVIWCGVLLHARWGGIIKERGLMAGAIFGNIVTSYSWFGVNMLGVGLHSYGFMDKAFAWLMAFVASQLVLIGLCILPLRYWKSFRIHGTRAIEPVTQGKGGEAGNLAQEEKKELVGTD